MDGATGSTTIGKQPCSKCKGPTRGLNEMYNASNALEIEYCPSCDESWVLIDGALLGRTVPILHDFIDRT